MATSRNPEGQLEEEFQIIFHAKKRRKDWKITELLDIKKGEIIKLNRHMNPLSKEKGGDSNICSLKG